MDKFPPEFYKLSPKRQGFARKFLIFRDATKAAEESGYSSKTAASQGSRLLKLVKPVIDLVDQQVKDELLLKYEITEEKILRELHRIAFQDNRALYREDGTLKAPHEWDDDTAAAMSGVEVYEEMGGKGEDRAVVGRTKKVKTWDKKGALELLGKYKGMWKEVGSKENPAVQIHKIERVIVKAE